MKKNIWQVIALALVIVLGMGTYGSAESQLEPNPEWLSEAAIDEAYACLFPLDGEKNVELAMEILLPLVENGNAEAQYYWGFIYETEIVDNHYRDDKEALYWYELAAEQGFPKAYLAMSQHDEFEAKAPELLELANQAGLFEMTPEELGADGCTWVGMYYSNNQDYKNGHKWFEKGAEMGCASSMNNLGFLYYQGLGVKKNLDVALKWLLKSAELGHVNAMQLYAGIYLSEGYPEKIRDEMYAANLEEYRETAAAGDPVAMYNIGYMYDNWLGGLRENERTAMEWFEKAANLGDTHAMCQLGLKYWVESDYETSMEWYLRAAELGNTSAMIRVGHYYRNGHGVSQNETTAKEWYLRAAELGDSNAYCALGDLAYSNWDLTAYEEWYSKAIEQGNTEAILTMGYSDEWLEEHATHFYYTENTDGYIDEINDWRMCVKPAFDLMVKAAEYGHPTAALDLVYLGWEESSWIVPFLTSVQADYWEKKGLALDNATTMETMGYRYYNNKGYDSAMKYFLKAYEYGSSNAAQMINEMLKNKQGVNAYFENYIETGIADFEEYTGTYKTLKEGSSGSAVDKMKKRLQDLGYFKAGSSMSDEYNSTTTDRVKMFQKANGLPETGVADEATLTLLYSNDAKANPNKI